MNFVEQLEIKAIGIFALTKSHIYPADAINAIVKLCVRETAKEIKNELDYSGDVETGFSYAKEKCDHLITQAEETE